MKLSATLEKALNDQLNLELQSAYAYLGMAAHFEGTPFEGFASWMKKQSEEELEHADKFFQYLGERNGRISVGAIAAPKCEYASPLEAFRTSLAHEQKVSAAILAIYDPRSQKRICHAIVSQVVPGRTGSGGKSVGDMVAKLELMETITMACSTWTGGGEAMPGK